MSVTPDSEQTPTIERPLPKYTAMGLERSYLRTLVSADFRPFLGMVALTILTGTIAYSLIEKWSFLDSLYFCVITLATIGYGDKAPATGLGKIFTIFYVFVGVGTLGLFINTVARAAVKPELQRSAPITETTVEPITETSK